MRQDGQTRRELSSELARQDTRRRQLGHLSAARKISQQRRKHSMQKKACWKQALASYPKSGSEIRLDVVFGADHARFECRDVRVLADLYECR